MLFPVLIKGAIVAAMITVISVHYVHTMSAGAQLTKGDPSDIHLLKKVLVALEPFDAYLGLDTLQQPAVQQERDFSRRYFWNIRRFNGFFLW